MDSVISLASIFLIGLFLANQNMFWYILYKVCLLVVLSIVVQVPYIVDHVRNNNSVPFRHCLHLVLTFALLLFQLLRRTIFFDFLIVLYFLLPLEYAIPLLIPLAIFAPSQSQQREIIDGKDYSMDEYVENLKDMSWCSNNLGSFYCHHSCIKPFSTLLDLGCGGGDFLKFLSPIYPNGTFTGIDLNSDAIQIAQKEPISNIQFLCKNLFDLKESFDVVTCSFFFHHIPRQDIPLLVGECLKKTKSQFIIRDLTRSWLSWFFFKYLMGFYFTNRLTRNDGALSILRSYTIDEWISILKDCGLDDAGYKMYRLPFDQVVIVVEPESR
jgi:2-polyprenyl-3-methyl-5-hydroxy-6-metoxy-1,4-benzoquinol methylase